MAASVQSQRDADAFSRLSFSRLSIVWKLTLFVGVLVALISGLLIAAAYFTTSWILLNQVDRRLSVVAADRQRMLATTLRQYEQHAARFASRNGLDQLFARRATGKLTPEQFRAEVESILASALANTTGLLAIWVEDDAGRVLAASGPADLIAAYSRLERAAEEPEGSMVVSPHRQGNTFGMVFSAVVRDRAVLGRAMLLTDFQSVAGILMDFSGLEETGDVLVGIGRGENIDLLLPLRGAVPVTQIAASEFPPLRAAILGEHGFAHASTSRARPFWQRFGPWARDTKTGAWSPRSTRPRPIGR